MEIKLGTIDWNAISAISTLLAVVVALFYQPFLNRRKLRLETAIITDPTTNEHHISFTVTNLSAAPIWMVSFGYLYKDGEKVVANFLSTPSSPQLLQPSEPIQLSTPSLKFHLKNFDRFFAKDSYGKFWYLSRNKKKILKEQIEICLSNNPNYVEHQTHLIAKPKKQNANKA
ncbi:hypothetical protein [Aeromonas hydrophila]|uniref:hypothetical protein n=1 Tax=Aeromonas hydrophila TaxID=644 RepID=UPI0038D139C9